MQLRSAVDACVNRSGGAGVKQAAPFALDAGHTSSRDAPDLVRNKSRGHAQGRARRTSVRALVIRTQQSLTHEHSRTRLVSIVAQQSFTFAPSSRIHAGCVETKPSASMAMTPSAAITKPVR